MIIFHKSADLLPFLRRSKATGNRIGFVPTMGALHQGHLNLVEAARKSCNLVVVSIFVNPTQFNDPNDFARYPTPLAKDLDLLLAQGCHVLYLPTTADIYPLGLQHLPQYQLGYLDTILEAQYRPGHFQGVCQVVDRLLQAVAPTTLFLGQKDLQQCRVIARMLEQTPHGQTTQLTIINTVRESDGLAMSSRNMHLSAEGRKKAVAIYEALQMLQQKLHTGAVDWLLQEAETYLRAAGLTPEYVCIADAVSLQPCTEWDGKQPLVALIAAYLEGVRLIDNMLLTTN